MVSPLTPIFHLSLFISFCISMTPSPNFICVQMSISHSLIFLLEILTFLAFIFVSLPINHILNGLFNLLKPIGMSLLDLLGNLCFSVLHLNSVEQIGDGEETDSLTNQLEYLHLG